ncbi:MAG: hypothetical protein GXP55_07315 [Deltaproteobacteria bacterium]|nr:hypothetical protein [Deltaproteobacteria bacterium]
MSRGHWELVGRSGLCMLAFTLGCAGAQPRTAGAAPARSSLAAAYRLGELPAVYRDDFERAKRLMDAGRLDESVALLDAIRRRAPHNEFVLHELALAYRLSHRPEKAVELLAPYEAVLTVQSAASFGSAFDEAGRPDEAEAALRRAIGRFPRAALLYSELAAVLAMNRRMDESVEMLARGMRAEPTNAAIHHQGAAIFANSRAGAMTLYWGEVFRLLEPGSERSAAMGEAMVNVLRQNVEFTPSDESGAYTISTHLAPGSPSGVLLSGGRVGMPFMWAYEQLFAVSLSAAGVHEINLANLHSTRAVMIEHLGTGGAGPVLDQDLFVWLEALRLAGHLEAYDYWLLGPGFPQEWETWRRDHADALTALSAYIASHPFHPTAGVAPEDPVLLRAGPPPETPVTQL